MTNEARLALLKKLLRNLDTPSSVAGNPLLGRIREEDARRAVDAALEGLSARSRAIVERCDIARELHAIVARDLGISKRHLYRERRNALIAIHGALGRGRLPPASRSAPLKQVEPETAAVTAVNPLLYTPRVAEAVPILERALVQGGPVCPRVRLLLKLSSIYCQTGQLEKAAAAIVRAQEVIGESAPAGQAAALKLEAATAECNLLKHRGKHATAAQNLMRAIAKASPRGDADSRLDFARAMANAQLALANHLGFADRYSAAVAYAIEANRIIRRFDLESILVSRGLTQMASLSFFAGAPANAALPNLQAAYDIAQANGFVIDCLQAATSLSFLYSFAGRHENALRFARAALQVVEGAGMSTEFAEGAYYTIASVQYESGDLTGARMATREFQKCAGRRPAGSAYGMLLEAQLLSAGERRRDALVAAQRAVAQFSSEGRKRMLGTALRLRAELEDALDMHRQARETAREAVGLLARAAPAGAQSKAYAVLARLTGNHRHRRAFAEAAGRAQLTVEF